MQSAGGNAETLGPEEEGVGRGLATMDVFAKHGVLWLRQTGGGDPGRGPRRTFPR